MIKTIELFQGAIVQYERHTFRVSGVIEEDIFDGQSYKGEETAIYLKKPHSMWRIPPESQKKIKPIPITPEIAKKLGFRKKRGSSHMWEYYQKGAIEIWFKSKRVDSVWWNTTILLTHQKRICVHRLQRALLEKTRIRIDFSKLLK